MAHPGTPFPISSADAASASLPGVQSVADFNKLATVPTGGVAGFSYISAEIDFTVPAVHVIVPPQTGKIFAPAGHSAIYTTKDGTVTTGPTIKFGTNASNDNLLAATAQTTFATQAQDTKLLFSGTVLPNPSNADMVATGYRLEITVGAVLGTATMCKARIMLPIMCILPI